MSNLTNPRRWAELTIAEVKLGGPRRTRRLIYSAAKIARHPEKSFPQIFNWDELRRPTPNRTASHLGRPSEAENPTSPTDDR